MDTTLLLTSTILSLVALYFLSRFSTQLLLKTIYKISGSEKMSYYLLALLYFPGTLFHEMAHLLMALGLFLKVHKVRLFPTFQNGYLRLGAVEYEGKDIVRQVLVGIAPFLAGIALFLILDKITMFLPEHNFDFLWKGYLVFVISSSMFSSKKDMEDVIRILPILVLLVFCAYIFGLFPYVLQALQLLEEQSRTRLLSSLLFSLFLSLAIHVISIVGCSIVLKITRIR